MYPFKYYDLMRICKDTKYLRLKLVQFARQEGVKPAAPTLSGLLLYMLPCSWS